METAIRERGETPFPEAGEGVVLCYRNSDLKRIEAEFSGPHWFNEFVQVSMMGTPAISQVETLARHGAKKDGKPFDLDDEIFDKIPVHDLAEKIFDAVCRSMRGMSAQEYVDDVMASIAEADKNDGPPA